MITDQDIDKMKEVFVTKDEFKETIAILATKEDIRSIQALIEKSISKTDTYSQELTMLGHQVDRHDKQIKSIAGHVNFKLDY